MYYEDYSDTLLFYDDAGKRIRIFTASNLYQKNASLTEFFTEVYKQTGYSVVWTTNNLKKQSGFQANFVNEPIDAAVNKVLRGLPLTYSIIDKSIFIKEKPPEVGNNTGKDIPEIADITVTGTVRDSKGRLMPGVNIMVADNPKQGTVTDNNGNFVLTVKEGTVLRISFIGFLSQTFTITQANKVLKVVLLDDVKRTEEIVVTAYGKKDRSHNSSVAW